LELACALYEGLLPLAERYQVAIAGGDTNTWDGGLVLSVTAIGVPGPGGLLLRSGARPGDEILVTGEFGGSILGHQFDFDPRVDPALFLAERFEVHAGIDCSDGLARDLNHICLASGCGADVELTAVPIAAAAEELSRQRADGITPLEHALHDGEDFELILAVPSGEATRIARETPLAITRIGRFIAEPGLWQIDASGKRESLPPKGWEH
jgi:thiamine-monophosphate kinase